VGQQTKVLLFLEEGGAIAAQLQEILTAKDDSLKLQKRKTLRDRRGNRSFLRLEASTNGCGKILAVYFGCLAAWRSAGC